LRKSILENTICGGSEHSQYHLATDASKKGLGGVLSQLMDCKPGTLPTPANWPKMKIVMFISTRFADAETLHTTTEKEALAVIKCLTEVRWLILGARHPTKVYTDPSALIAKWQTKLAEYDLEYVHIPGTQKVIADGMSRIPAQYFALGATDENVEKKGKKIGKKYGGSEPANGEVEEVFAVTLEEQKGWKNGWIGNGMDGL
jgi:hypothetical protein